VPTKLCLEPRCPNPARPGKGRCVDHDRQAEAARSARRRETTNGIFKTKRWALTRGAVLARDPICKACDNALSTQVDHIVPLEDGGDPYRLEGLQGLCDPCHWSKTARENAARGKGTVAA
jgi:5-methylcytosine-specific restriction endonuclease McrA